MTILHRLEDLLEGVQQSLSVTDSDRVRRAKRIQRAHTGHLKRVSKHRVKLMRARQSGNVEQERNIRAHIAADLDMTRSKINAIRHRPKPLVRRNRKK